MVLGQAVWAVTSAIEFYEVFIENDILADRTSLAEATQKDRNVVVYVRPRSPWVCMAGSFI